MERVPEPELMLDDAQARAYAEADFAEPHERIVTGFVAAFPELPTQGALLDLGCGPGDITFRLARRLPQWRIDGVDGSPAMLRLARERLAKEPEAAGRVRFVVGRLPEADLPEPCYDVGFSNSLLHHLPDPMVLWQAVRRYVAPGGWVYVADLFRPASRDAAAALVETYSADEPEVLKRDFFNSLLAAFTPEEVRQQLADAGLASLTVRAISDRHLVVSGHLPKTPEAS
jgi:ubiquinone/menaquinone biosynthesis C-methylase UbiE